MFHRHGSGFSKAKAVSKYPLEFPRQVFTVAMTKRRPFFKATRTANAASPRPLSHKMKLELWQEYMYGEEYSMRYPKDFYGNVIIRQMDRGDDPIYEVELHEAFPQVIAAQTLDMLTDNIKEGVSTDHIDKLG